MDSFDFATLWQKTPLPMIAILRGLTPEDAPEIGDALLEAGFTAGGSAKFTTSARFDHAAT